MGFHVFLVCGFLGGLLGGMGMGGGTALIPLLTLACGVEQSVAQGVNLVAFLPTALVALTLHVKGGLVRGEGLLPLMLPSLLSSALFALLSALLPAHVLQKAFGAFLIGLAALQFASLAHEGRAGTR